MSHSLPSPYGGALVEPAATPERCAELAAHSREWPSWDLTPRQLLDLEQLLTGGFSPLGGFMTAAEAASVARGMRLPDGVLWPVPVVLEVDDPTAERAAGGRLALRDAEGVMLAVLHVAEVWRTSEGRPCIGGRLEGVQPPHHYDYRLLRRTPRELREEFAKLGWRRVAAHPTAWPMHRPQHAAALHAAAGAGANLLLQAVAGPVDAGDREHYATVRALQAVTAHYPRKTAVLSVLPYAARPAGLRDGLLRAIVARNHGCSHLIVAEDWVPATVEHGAEELPAHAAFVAALAEHAAELGVEVLDAPEEVYLEDRERFVRSGEVPEGARARRLPGGEARQLLRQGRRLPSWYAFPEVAEGLARSFPPRHRQGFTVFFTGLSGSGKSTLANVLLTRLMEMGGRPVTLLDGDIVRKNLSSELGFSKEHRDINIRRIGFVASEITKNGGIALCAPIAPYDAVRRQVRAMVEPVGGFVLVHVAAPLEVCEQRDRKGLYAKARAGIIKEFTGISDPYEEPADAELVLDTSELSPEEAVQEIVLLLEREGYIGANGDSAP